MARTKGKGNIQGILIVFFVIVVFILLRSVFDFGNITDISYLKQTILSFGIFAPVVYMLVMAIAIIISPIPSLPLSVAAGALWGPYLATLYSVIGAEIGAIIAFLIARKLGRQFIIKFLKKDIILFCDRCTQPYMAWIVFVARLFPIFQFDIVSYGAGLTNMRLRNFAIATFFGMIPATYVFAAFGEGLFIGQTFTLILTMLLIIALFAVPILIKKHNLFGFRDKISIK